MDDTFNRPKTRVQWILGNSCNYNCSYCNEMFRLGDKNKVTDDLLLDICKDITYHYDDLGRDVVFEFLGGEPTLQKKIPDIGKRLSNFPTSITLKTNGSASLEWWNRARSVLGGVVISVHREFADIDHICRVVEFLQNPDYGYPIYLEILFPVTHRSESFDWGVEQVKKFRKRFNLGNLQMLYSDFARGSSMFLPYSETQWETWYKFNPKMREEPVKDGLYRYQPIFTGQTCYAGIETLTIDADGDVWRGWCRQGNIIGNIHKSPVPWPTTPIVCQKDFCHNGFDRQATKKKI